MTLDTKSLVSVVTVSYNRCQHILELLSSLREQNYPRLEIIVVDNASIDGTADRISALFPEVSLVRNPRNTGMDAYNTGMARARGDYILFIDDDGLPETIDWVSQMISKFENNPNLGAIACNIKLFETGESAPDNPQHLLVADGFEGYPCPAFVCTGAGLRASVLEMVGGFPGFFFIDYMEAALCARLWDLGWEVRFFPQLNVLHKKTTESYQHNRAYGYWGLRSYYWYVWTLYPWPAVFEETIYHILHTLKMFMQGKCKLRVWLRALGGAVSGYRVAREHRHPITKQTLGWLHQLRGHRRPSFFTEVRASRRQVNDVEKKC